MRGVSRSKVSKSMNSPFTMRRLTLTGTGSCGVFGRLAYGDASVSRLTGSCWSSGGTVASGAHDCRGTGSCDDREMLSASCGGGGRDCRRRRSSALCKLLSTSSWTMAARSPVGVVTGGGGVPPRGRCGCGCCWGVGRIAR